VQQSEHFDHAPGLGGAAITVKSNYGTKHQGN
jgi:hypothetical protein